MALLRWTELSWDEFVTGLEGFRDNYSGKSREDETYVGCLALMQSRPLQARASGRELVDILNRWACRLSSVKTPGLIAGWAHDHMTHLEEFEPLTIVDAALPDQADELGSLHDDLIAHVKAGGVPNMGDAAASKTLHMLIPELFVMWDKEIKRSEPEGTVRTSARCTRSPDDLPPRSGCLSASSKRSCKRVSATEPASR